MREIAVLAVDAGGTGCRAVLCDAEGDVLGYSQGGACNYHCIGAEAATATLVTVLRSLAPEEAYPLRVPCAVFGMAALDTEQDQRVLEQVVKQALVEADVQADQVIVDNDGMITLLGAVGHQDGVLIISGTGSIACGVTRTGQQCRVGGWGHRIGDEGSAYAMGKAALSHVLRAYDGREAASRVTDTILQEMGFVHPEDVMAWTYGPDFSVDRVASLTLALARLAEDGDWKAQEIVKSASAELANMALAAIRNLGLLTQEFALVLLGGVLQENRMIQDQVIGIIRRECPAVRVHTPLYKPICGGVLRGLMELNIHDPNVLQRLQKGLPTD